MQRDPLDAWLRLSATPGLGRSSARQLLARFGSPQAVLQHSPASWRECIGAGPASALAKGRPDQQALLQTTWDWLQAGGDGQPARAIVALGDPAYPPALLHTPDPPLLLYLLGAAALLDGCRPFAPARCLAMVGSRYPTAQGADNARRFAQALGAQGLCIVSGLALGVDAAAHEGALSVQPGALRPGQPALTIAVVGTGLDRVYPRAHHGLAQRIAARGLLVSEYPLGTPPLPAHFPQRNRIISGLAQGTLVVEAALASGSLITARMAAEQGREVLAIPGSIHAPQSRGCHALIREGACLVETVQDVLQELPPATDAGLAGHGTAADAPPPALALAATPRQDEVLQALGYDPVSLDLLIARSGLDAAQLQARLLELELDGQVARLPGGLFQRIGLA